MHYYSSGKLLITGEYLVLNGAKALVAPVKFGQSLSVENSHEDDYLTWESLKNEKSWFKAKFDVTALKIIAATDHSTSERLLEWLSFADRLNPGFLENQKGKKAITNIDFDLKWGLGSSSTLLSNIAYWAAINPFKLHLLVSKGSGYDVVFARKKQPGYFTRIDTNYKAEYVEFNPSFKEHIYFIFTGNKQDSSASVKNFTSATGSWEKEIEIISTLSGRFAMADKLADFEECIRNHEEIISRILGQRRLKEIRFIDLQGEIKSLGAWGGDFAMITWPDSEEELKKYLKTKNIDIIFPFDKIIKQSEI